MGSFKLYVGGTLGTSVLKSYSATYNITANFTEQPSEAITYRISSSVEVIEAQTYSLLYGQTETVSFPQTYPITYTRRYLKTFSNSFAEFTYSVRGSVDLVGNFTYPVLEQTPIHKRSPQVYNILSGAATLFAPQYKVLLDGSDVTAKVSSCEVSYSRDQYCGEVNITWADMSLYTSLDCSRPQNFKVERIEVLAKVRPTDEWASLGKFFLEKRGNTAAFGTRVPTSWGRTRTAALARPYAKPVTDSWLSDTDCLLIAQEIIAAHNLANPSLPIVLDWRAPVYPIYAGNYSANSEDPIAIIAVLAAVTGAIVTTNLDAHLVVELKYPV